MSKSDSTKITSGPGHVEIGAVNGQVVVYIPALDHHVAFAPDEAMQFATLILKKTKAAMMQGRPHV